MEGFSKRDIGLHAQDIATGLQKLDLQTDLFDATRKAGMIARLATHIRGAEVIQDFNRMKALGSQLGIDTLLVKSVLESMADLGWVELETKGGIVKTVEERVPHFSDIYEEIGGWWEAQGPSEIEQASILALEQLLEAPLEKVALRNKLGLSKRDYGLVLDVGKSGAYMKEYMSPMGKEPVVYSPLYWGEKPEAIYDLLQRFSAEEIQLAFEQVQRHQGFPLPEPGSPEFTKQHAIIYEAMQRGILPTPSVESTNGKRLFAFTPYVGNYQLVKTDRTILDKAMAILSCVRYGQYYGDVTKIRHPLALLEGLRNRRKIGPHSEIKRQYSLLVIRKIGQLERDVTFSDRYFISLIPTEENLRAADVAIDMYKIGKMVSAPGLDDAAQQALFIPGIFSEPLITIRQTEKQAAQLRMESVEILLDRLMDDIREG